MQYILALLPFIGWGTGNIFSTYASRKAGSFNTTFYTYVLSIILASLLLPFFLPAVTGITLPLLLLNIILGTAYVTGSFLVNEAFRQASTSVAGVIVQSFPPVVLLLSALIFHDPLSGKQLLWIALIFAGVLCCSIKVGDFKSVNIKSNSGVKFALLAAGIFAVYFTFFRLLTNAYGWFLPNYISFLTLPLALIISRKIIKTKDSIVVMRNLKVALAVFFSAVLLRAGDIALNLGISLGYAAVVSPAAGAAPVLFVVSSYFVFRDKISRQQVIGIICALAGLVGLGFFV